jgi:hypothetical protein
MYIKPRRSVLNSQPVKSIAIVAFLLAAFGIVGYFDAEDAQLQEDHYCEMVAIYKSDANAGIAPANRRGWPEYRKGEVVCQ